MDIVNWSALQTNLLIRESLSNSDDLILVGANASWNKRGDKYQTYAVPASALVGGSGAIAIEYNGNPISATATVLNFVGGVTVSGDPLVTIDIPTGPIIFKNTNSGTIVGGGGFLVETYSQIIPGKTVKPGSIIKVTYRVAKDPLANTDLTRIAISIGPTPYAIADINWSVIAPNAYGQIKREFVVTSGNKTKFASNKYSLFSDDNEFFSEEIDTIDWTINQTFSFGIQNTGLSDSAAGSFYCIEIY